MFRNNNLILCMKNIIVIMYVIECVTRIHYIIYNYKNDTIMNYIIHPHTMYRNY